MENTRKAYRNVVLLSYEAWYGFLQMKSQTIRRLVKGVICPFFASPPPQISQSSYIFLMLQKPSVNVRCSAKVHSPKDSRNSEQKNGGFLPNSHRHKRRYCYPFYSGRANLSQRPFWQGKKKKIFHSATSNHQNERGVCIWKNSSKPLAEVLIQREGIKQVGKEEKMEEILKITKAQLENLPVGEKAPQLARKNVHMYCILLWDQEGGEEKWT